VRLRQVDQMVDVLARRERPLVVMGDFNAGYGSGHVDVSDLVAINLAIFNPAQATPLCDGNNDGMCNVQDTVAANIETFSPNETSRCGRQPCVDRVVAIPNGSGGFACPP
jgi:endonuclease/exonuclease/phosphatase family metal-dependent hydrolase